MNSETLTSPSFKIGAIPIHGDLVLSPMEGYSDQPYRSLCRELGSAMSYTEFISAIEILQDNPRIETKLAFLSEERPLAYQIFDNDPRRLLEAALRLQERGPDIIDINMGCSVRRVSGRGAGAGLLRTPIKVARIFRMLSSALEVPVTAKIRLGWDDGMRNYLLIARAIEENGGALVAVHGRTKAQGYSGQADWDAIAEIKACLSVPVVANGDVRSVADIEQIKAYTGCEAVMIGRAAIGNPWIFSRQDRHDVPVEKVRAMMLEHLDRMLAFYGRERGLVLFRKHAKHYVSPERLTRQQSLRLLTAEQPGEFLEALEAVYA
jgi:nifR3 family TIM-barrel protein